MQTSFFFEESDVERGVMMDLKDRVEPLFIYLAQARSGAWAEHGGTNLHVGV